MHRKTNAIQVCIAVIFQHIPLCVCVTFNISEFSKYWLIFFWILSWFPTEISAIFFLTRFEYEWNRKKSRLSVKCLNSKMNIVLFPKLKSYVRYVAHAEHINWCPCRVIVCHSHSLMPFLFILCVFFISIMLFNLVYIHLNFFRFFFARKKTFFPRMLRIIIELIDINQSNSFRLTCNRWTQFQNRLR